MSVHVLSFVDSNLPQCLPYPRSVFEDGYPMSHFFRLQGTITRAAGIVNVNFPTFVVVPLVKS